MNTVDRYSGPSALFWRERGLFVLASDYDALESRYREVVELLRSVLDKSEVSENSKLGEDINAFLAGEDA